MTTPARPARWPRKPPTPALAELREIAATLPGLCSLDGVGRYQAAAALLRVLPQVLRAVRDEAVVRALHDGGLTYRTFAAAVGRHHGTVNKSVSSHHSRTKVMGTRAREGS